MKQIPCGICEIAFGSEILLRNGGFTARTSNARPYIDNCVVKFDEQNNKNLKVCCYAYMQRIRVDI